jgi:hypothetical protein
MNIFNKNPYKEILDELKKEAINCFRKKDKLCLAKIINAMKEISIKIDDNSYKAYRILYDVV